MYCRKCGKKLKDKSRYCEYCGAKVNDEIEQMDASAKAGAGTNRRWIRIVMVLCVIICAIIGIGIFVFALPKKRTPDAVADTSQPVDRVAAGNSEEGKDTAAATEEIPDTETETTEIPTEIPTENSELKECAQMYMDIVRQQEEASGLECQYDLVYINDDEIPELVMGPLGYWTSLYTYDSGKIYTSMDEWAYGAGSGCYYYLPEKNVIYRNSQEQVGLINYDEYWRVDDNYEVCPYYEETLSIWSFRDQNNDGQLDNENEAVGEEGTYYYYGTTELTKEQYEEYVIGGDYQELIGTKNAADILEELELLCANH